MVVFGHLQHRDLRFGLKKLDLQTQILEVFEALKANDPNIFLLERMESSGKLIEYSFLGFNPILIIEVWEEFTRIYDSGSIEELEGNPFIILREIVKPSQRLTHKLRFVGGLAGYVSFEAAYLWDDLEVRSKPGDGFPLMRLALFTDSLVYDHLNHTYYYCFVGENRLPEILKKFKDWNGEPMTFTYKKPQSNLTKDKFIEMTLKGKQYIQNGEVFQVVLSRRLMFESRGDLLPFYKELRKLNPSPYMYYIKFGEEELVGASPETLVRVEHDVVTTFPIAGTRPRANNPDKEKETDLELLRDEKELAEHMMLVDLARNDLGKVAFPGTVKVTKLKELTKYSHVKHLVSCVEAKLKPGKDMYDAFKAVFPAGTVSGAPKPRAIEIINELEPVKRGPYAGSVGYFSYNGYCDFAITIRTLIRLRELTLIQAGAGIVWDSDPEKEWLETAHKMEALIEALKRGGARESLNT